MFDFKQINILASLHRIRKLESLFPKMNSHMIILHPKLVFFFVDKLLFSYFIVLLFIKAIDFKILRSYCALAHVTLDLTFYFLYSKVSTGFSFTFATIFS